MQLPDPDVIIAGAGPAGTTLALMLARSGATITIIDKEKFPRDKICGDALSGKAISVIKRMPGDIWSRFNASVPKTPSPGMRFISPGLHEVEFRFTESSEADATGFIVPRREFDSFLVSALKAFPNIRLIEGERITGIERDNNGITVKTGNFTFRGKVLAGADGIASLVRSTLCKDQQHPGICTGLRAYFEGVKGSRDDGYIELFFFRELLPFYFWIFPETNGLWNVGLAMMRRDISERRVNLGLLLDKIVRSHPLIAPRFAEARVAGKPGAHSLPLAMPPGPFSGDRFVLLGDAASLVDPFTGEGIGNAIASAEVAARVIRQGLEKADLSAAALREYDRQLMKRLGKDVQAGRILHRLAKHPKVFDFSVKRIKKNKALHSLISSFFFR